MPSHWLNNYSPGLYHQPPLSVPSSCWPNWHGQKATNPRILMPGAGSGSTINTPVCACAAISRNSHQGDMQRSAIREKGDMTNLLLMAYQVVDFHFELLDHRYGQLNQKHC